VQLGKSAERRREKGGVEAEVKGLQTACGDKYQKISEIE